MSLTKQITIPFVPATAAITPISRADITAETMLVLTALTTRIVCKPLSVMKPVERCGRVVTMEVLADPQFFYTSPDPLFPIPLVALPDKFWNTYSKFIDVADGYMTILASSTLGRSEKQRWLRIEMKKAWKLADKLVNLASSALRQHEALYFSVRLRASLAGEFAKV